MTQAAHPGTVGRPRRGSAAHVVAHLGMLAAMGVTMLPGAPGSASLVLAGILLAGSVAVARAARSRPHLAALLVDACAMAVLLVASALGPPSAAGHHGGGEGALLAATAAGGWVALRWPAVRRRGQRVALALGAAQVAVMLTCWL